MRVYRTCKGRRWGRFFLIGALLSVFALAGCHRWKDKSPQEKMLHVTERIESKLDLNQVQKQELDKLGSLFVEAAQSIKEDRKANYEFAIAQIEAQEIDDEAVLALTKKRMDQMDRNLPRLVGQLKVFHSTLNSEQKQKIAGLVRDRLDRLED